MLKSEQPWGAQIIKLEETASTNDYAKELAKKGYPQGTVVCARKQLKGHGRLQRTWASPQGGLWFSILLKPDKIPQGLPLLVSLWISSFIEANMNLICEIRWPNDIYVNSKKLGGILLEGVMSSPENSFIIVGIGLNVNNKSGSIPSEYNSISLIELTNHEENLDYLLEDLLMHLQFNYEIFLSADFKAFKDEICERCTMLGEQIEIQTETGKRQACAKGIGDDGQLIIDNDEEIWGCDRIKIKL